MNSFAKSYGEILFGNHVTTIDLESYGSVDSFITNNKNFLFGLKEYPQSLLIINNLDNCIYEMKDYINKIIKEGKVELEKDMIYLNHLTIINIEKEKESSLGFNNYNKLDGNRSNMFHFNKEEEYIVI